MMKNSLLVERWYREFGTYGNGYVLDPFGVKIFQFKTLELPWKNNRRGISCIPEDEYDVIEEGPTKNRDYVYFRVLNVPGRSGILWHPGNYTRQIKGCTLPGSEFKYADADRILDVVNTSATLKTLTSLMEPKFKLKIVNGEKVTIL